jgi:adenine deaminase
MFQAGMVFTGGKLIARDGEMVIEPVSIDVDDSAVRSRVQIKNDTLDFTIPAKGTRMRVIGAMNDQVVTGHLVLEPTVRDGQAVADPERDLLKMAVIERHHGSGNIGLGFVQGIGINRGAIATTVCHDHHNLIVIGVDDTSMHTAVRAIQEMGGGEVVVDGDTIIQSLPLPIAGLMSDRPLEEVRQNQEVMLQAAAGLGCALHDPFMTMSFLALEVIPTLKLTDQGLVDVTRFEIVPLWSD